MGVKPTLALFCVYRTTGLVSAAIWTSSKCNEFILRAQLISAGVQELAQHPATVLATELAPWTLLCNNSILIVHLAPLLLGKDLQDSLALSNDLKA